MSKENIYSVILDELGFYSVETKNIDDLTHYVNLLGLLASLGVYKAQPTVVWA